MATLNRERIAMGAKAHEIIDMVDVFARDVFSVGILTATERGQLRDRINALRDWANDVVVGPTK